MYVSQGPVNEGPVSGPPDASRSYFLELLRRE